MNARIVRTGLCLAGGLLLPALMNAQNLSRTSGLDRTKAPAPGPAPVVHLGEHTSFLLSNGMRVIVVENHKLPMVGVQVRFDIPPFAQGDKTGFIDMVGDLLTTGAGRRNKAAIDEAVDRLGASLHAASDGVYANGLKKHLPELLGIVGDVVKFPTFPEQELEKARKRYASTIQQRKDDPDAIAEAVGRSVTFGRTHPYGEVMTEKTLRAIGRKEVAAYHTNFFRPEAGYLVFVGDITEKEAKELAKGTFGAWKPAPVPTIVNENGTETIDGIGPVRLLKKPSTARGARRVIIVDRPGAAQSIVHVAFPLNLEPKDVRALNAQVMNTILGGGVFNARLMQNLREDKGWTYGAGSTLASDRYNGHFTAAFSVRTEVTDSAIIETMGELERMASTPVSREELDLAKSYMAGSFARSLEDPQTVARFALNTYLNGLEPDHYATYLKRLEAVTAQHVMEAAQAFLFPDNAAILVVGDKQTLLPKLEPLSRSTNPAVLELDYNGSMYVEELTPVSDRKVGQVLEAYITAIGGRTAIDKLGGVLMRVTTEMGGMPIAIKQWYGTNGGFRTETKAGEMMLQEEIYDGARAVRKSPQGEEELQDVDLSDLQFNGHAVPEMHYGKTTERMVLSGRTEIDGRSAYKVTLMTPSGTSVGDYFDTETGLKLRRVDNKFMYGKSLTITTDYSDYKAVGGVLFPHTISQSGGPTGAMVLKVTDIETGKTLLPSFFETGLPPYPED